MDNLTLDEVGILSLRPGSAKINGSAFDGSGVAFAADIMYSDSSPREGTVASRYFWILDGVSQALYSSRRAHPNSGAFGVWQSVSIPAGQWLQLAGNANSDIGLTGCFGADAKIMTKNLPLTNSDTTDYPWTSYSIPTPMHGGVPIIGMSDVDFWTPDITATVAVINDSNVICAGKSSNPSAGATYEVWDSATNTPPAGTWNKLWGKISNTLGDYHNALLIGTGATFYRFYEASYADTAWMPFPCPSGTWVDITAGPSDDYAFCVGIGADAACANKAYPFEALTAFAMPAGWTGINPRVVYDPNMYNVDPGGGIDGTYIIVGGEIAGVSVVVCVPIRGSGSLLNAPIVATLPSVPADVKWRAIACNQVFEGVLIVGDSATDGICILSNPETSTAGTPDTYNDWTLKTLAEAPF